MKGKIKYPIRISSIILALFLLLGTGMPAFADNGAEGQVTFTNNRESVKGFSVTKSISNYSDVPEAQRETEFLFYLEVDERAARQETYVKYNSNRQQIYLIKRPGEALIECSESDVAALTEAEKENYLVPFKTDERGMFTLKAGESAVFTELDGGSTVHVTEYPVDGFTQETPAGGADYYGSVPSEGIEEAEFVNRYITPPPPDSSNGKGTLYVKKVMSQPSGYEASDMGSFTFALSINGGPWANKEYYIEDDMSGNKPKTDGNGRFTIEGGQTAVFDEVPAGVEFTLEEEEEEEEEEGKFSDWWFVGASLERDGTLMSFNEPEVTDATALSGDTRLVFTNSNTSFGVKKTVIGESEPTDKEFDFELKNEDDSPFTWAYYRLFDSNGKLMVDGDNNDGLRNTSTSGTFSLASGVTAMFYGIKPGTKYKVLEKADGEYRQVAPEDDDKCYEVQNSVQVLNFTNEKVEKTTSLSVTKNVSNLTGGVVPDADFSFTIYKITDTGDEQPLSRTPYVITLGSDEYQYETDEYGVFTLKAAQTAVFTRVESGSEYKVVEGNASVDNDKFVPEDGNTREGIVTDEGLYLEFTNDYGNFAEFSFYKIAEKLNSGDETKYLSGAEFQLVSGVVDGDEYVWSSNPDDSQIEVSAGNGLVSFKGLKNGVYKLSETNAPLGYEKSKGYWILTIDTDSDPTFTITGVNSPMAFIANSETSQLELPNREMILLPKSGSCGETVLTIISISFMLAGAAIYFAQRRKVQSGIEPQKE